MRADISLRIGGITPFTTIDFPNKLAAVIFFQGCPYRCRYCHNQHLQSPTIKSQYSWEDILKWLDTRIGLLDGIVLSGGEPLLQRGLACAVSQLHAKGFEVALHTSGVYPKRFQALLPEIDWVGLDIKAPFEDYETITGVSNGKHVRESLLSLLNSGKPYELRCTLDNQFFDVVHARKMAKQLAQLGVKRLILQTCRDIKNRKPKNVSEEVISAFSQILPEVIKRS